MSKKFHIFVLRLAAVLLVLVMMSFSMVSGRYARYTSTATGSDTVKVAKFQVVESSTLLTSEVAVGAIPGGTTNTNISVENKSEVAIEYRIDVNNPYKNLPISFQLKVGENLHSLPYTATMAPEQEKINYTLVTTWTGSNDISYAGKVDVLEISLSATQID